MSNLKIWHPIYSTAVNCAGLKIFCIASSHSWFYKCLTDFHQHKNSNMPLLLCNCGRGRKESHKIETFYADNA